MKRREFITLLGSVAAWPVSARAQQAGRTPRLGILTAFSDSDSRIELPPRSVSAAALRARLVRGPQYPLQTLLVGGDPNRIRACIKELAAPPPDVFLSIGTQALAALHQATRSTPIVFVQISGPVEGGFVASMARPGGNITGFANFESSFGGKWLALLKEIAPQLTRVLVVLNPDNPGSRGLSRTIEAGAPSLGIKVVAARVRDPATIETAIKAFASEPNGGLIVLPDQVTINHRDLIVTLATQHGLPAAYSHRLFAAAGGLLSYGADLADLYRRAAGYVDRILKGEKPADLPVQTPDKFLLVFNLKGAKAIGLRIPELSLLRADEIIE